LRSAAGGRLKINSRNQLVEGQPGQLGVVFDEPVSDMSVALGLYDPTKNQAYQGWYDTFNSQEPPAEDDYQKWTRNVWEKLGDEDNLQEAIDYAISQQTNLWDPNAPVNAYRLKGHGFFWDIRLRN
jgi:hypothetical protein